MRRVTLTVNGASVGAEVEPRTQLADFLRDTCLLPATHVGCEHGICGACTVLLDDAPARSCIAYAAACEGATVRTIEGLQDDPIMQRLRAAFTAEHALQCGYCTPGMLVTARDIVLRLPDADADRIRLELAGNLCRCTGYAGIVRAIGRVLREEVPRRPAVAAPLPALDAAVLAGADAASAAPEMRAAGHVAPAAAAPAAVAPGTVAAPGGLVALGGVVALGDVVAPGARAAVAALRQDGSALELTIVLDRPRDDIWAALHDPALLAACVPGAHLTREADGVLEGTIQVALGPIAAVFSGTGSLTLDAAAHRAILSGEGSDRRSHTFLSGTAALTLHAIGDARTQVALQLGYALRGPLAQFARASVVQALTAGIADTVAHNLERRLAGDSQTAVPARFSAGGLLLRVVWERLRRWLHLS